MSPHVLVVDNYDSFTYNLVQAFMIRGAQVSVRFNDRIDVEEAVSAEPTHVVISPGPGRPENAGVSMEIIDRFSGVVPVLGVCLGHQAIGHLLGSTVSRAQSLMHGKASEVYHDGKTIFAGLPNPFPAGRYHSLAVMEEGLSPDLVISAYTSDGEIMGLRHRHHAVEGVQFHPESVLTPAGLRLLGNFLDMSEPAASEAVA